VQPGLTYPLNSAPPSTQQLLHEVYKLYRNYFSRWFGITAFPTLLVTVILVIADQQVRGIFAGLHGVGVAEHPVDIIEAFLIRYGAFFLA
jgi:hypothetical protein